MQNLNGIILKGIGGFYYVEAAEQVYECKARGIFRKKGSAPCAGDKVKISVPNEGYASIEEILPRKNSLVRPNLANIDQLIIVISTCEPSPNLFIVDKMIATAVYKNIEPVIVITKTDLHNGEGIKEIYDTTGIKTFLFSPEDLSEKNEIYKLLQGKITAFTGNSGVGKSTLLNIMFPEFKLETGSISQKLGRGKHTTRSVDLYKIENGYVADTPGFSTVDLQRYEIIDKTEIAGCFSEFLPYINECRFNSCAHICEKGCAVLTALKKQEIHESRHKSYVEMYNEVKDIKEWQKR